jgi:hypothetical protein
MLFEKPQLFWLTYLLFALSLALIYFIFPENNYKFVAIGILPLIFWLPFDLYRLSKKRKSDKS